MARVVLGVTGGIAAYKAAEIVRLFRAQGHSVRCAVSRAATQFVTPLSLEVLSGAPVYQEEYLSACGSGDEVHIVLSQWADVVCVAPATAHTLVRLANGLADDFLSTTLLAYAGPLVVAPAMHSEMWNKPTTQAAVDKLRAGGAVVVGPDTGLLANGDVGLGRMSAPREIAAAVLGAAGTNDYQGLRVVITAGPTYEALDPVRFLGNRSSGRMGFALAEAAALRGASVDLVAGPVALATPPMVDRHDVRSAIEMQQKLAALEHRLENPCQPGIGTRVGESVSEKEHTASATTGTEARAEPDGIDLVIMCAAVADFRPRQTATQKIKRGTNANPTLELVSNPDILAGLAVTMPKAIRVGFAAETEDLEKNAQQKLKHKDVHFLCANDVSRTDVGFEATSNELVVFTQNGSRIAVGKTSKIDMAGQLLDMFLPVVLAR